MGGLSTRARALAEQLEQAIQEGDLRGVGDLIDRAALCRADRLAVCRQLANAHGRNDDDVRLVFGPFDLGRLAS
jgi:hypothetical protein